MGHKHKRDLKRHNASSIPIFNPKLIFLLVVTLLNGPMLCQYTGPYTQIGGWTAANLQGNSYSGSSKCVVSPRAGSKHATFHRVWVGGNDSYLFGTWIDGGVHKFSNGNRPFFSSELLGYATSIHYDVITVSSAQMSFYKVNFPNANTMDIYRDKYWTIIGGGSQSDLFTTSDGTSNDVMYMTYWDWFWDERKVYLLQISWGWSSASTWTAAWGSGR
jgi:hypothetical protein